MSQRAYVLSPDTVARRDPSGEKEQELTGEVW